MRTSGLPARRLHRRGAAAALALALCATAAGCSAGSDPSTTTSAAAAQPTAAIPSLQPVAALHAMLPESIKSSGVLRIGTVTVNPPMDFAGPNGQPMGVDVDLAKAVAQVLGVKPQFSEASLDAMIPGVLSGRWDVMWPGMNDTTAREKQVSVVDYVKHSFSVAVQAGNPKHIASTADFCGLTFGEVQGSVFQNLLPTISAQQCAPRSKPAIVVDTFPDNATAFEAIASGRIDAMLNALELIEYQAQHSPSIQAIQQISLQPVHYGVGVLPGNTQLITAIQAAINELIKDGTYQKILQEWNLTFMAIPQALVNHPTP